ncbi:putative beta-'-dioxygenase Brp protein [Halorhabdus tiamatea SARL4B]|uniref:Probable beta-carotene 15,15'-dioxygenase n=1 Tax=Halorhabdus tiamatea SARL4B TaxID=1033806 RepID=F7PMY4_9EURY|nr:Brp/Blh family beta-carotene 15,15'-dioxygenase [Halorhabdus tiamatea]ERJ07691.1 putative beta-'-dioxygenase Brp protein [Halorhabdus tiamatea SARL4B]CCQ32651.1 bacteriorhodopsin related protein [Halorhabdus tiamatea SARL4B]
MSLGNYQWSVLDVRSGWPGNRPIEASRTALVAIAIGFLALRAFGVELGLTLQAAIYLFGMVALNLPHGGYEHFNNIRQRGLTFQWRYVVGYLALVAGFVGLFALAPVAGLALAILVAVLKGGYGGVHVMDAETGSGHLRTPIQRHLAAFVRGGVVMAVPIVAWPGTFETFSAYMVNIFQPGGLEAVGRYFAITRPLIGLGFATLAIAHVGLGYVRRDGTRSWLVDAGETALLIVFFAVVPVVVAVGLYFPLWYSMRQVGRHVAIEDDVPEQGGVLTPFLESDDPRVIALTAWGVLIAGSIATVGVVGTIFLVANDPLGGAPLLPGAVAFWSISISIIALPHVVVGSFMDRERGIWYVP